MIDLAEQATTDPTTAGTGTRPSLITNPGHVVSPTVWPGTRALTASPLAPVGLLNLDEHLGQRQATWSFLLVDGVTNQRLGELHPIRQPAMITHDTNMLIKRTMRMALDSSETSAINPLRDRVLPYMHLAGVAYPLGRYMFTDPTLILSTAGEDAMYALLDEMFIINQQIETGFSSTKPVDSAVRDLLTGLNLPGTRIAPTDLPAVGGWAAGTTRGQILQALAEQGDYQTPWMDHQGTFRMVRTRDPENEPADLDLDTGRRVIRSSIGTTSDILNAPNRFVVVSNSGAALNAAIVGTFDIHPDSPHSIANRGFVVADVVNIQVASVGQARAVARARGLQHTVFTIADLDTTPDPRHDSYDIIRWQGSNWLELAWSMTCEEGAAMHHTMRRAVLV